MLLQVFKHGCSTRGNAGGGRCRGVSEATFEPNSRTVSDGRFRDAFDRIEIRLGAGGGTPAKAAWHAPEEEMLLSSHLFYAGFLTYLGTGNRALQWTETALRVLDAD